MIHKRALENMIYYLLKEEDTHLPNAFDMKVTGFINSIDM